MKILTKNIKGFYDNNIFYPFIAGGDGSDDSTDSDSGDAGKGDGNEGEGDDKAAKLFTQEQLNQIMATNKKGLAAQAAASNKALSDMKTEMAELRALLSKDADTGSDGDDSSGDDDSGLSAAELADKRLKYEQKKSRAALEASERKTSEVLKRLEETEARRLEAEKDRFLDEALTKSRCLDLKMGKRMFREQMQYDADANEWFFMSSEGVRMTPEEGVDADLPDYLRRAQASGGAGGKSPRAALEGSITQQKDKVKALKAKASKSGHNADLANVLQANRKLRELEADLVTK